MARVLRRLALVAAAVAAAAAQGVDVFDAAAVRAVSVTLPPDEWAALQANAIDEDWTRARVAVAGVDFGFDVGLRFKGSSTLRGCLDGDGVLICDKLSMKIRFDRYDGPRYQPGGIRTLNLHSMVRDPSKMHEKIAYKLFNDVGVAAPRSHWVTVVVNGEDLGVFSVVDQVDEVFITRLDAGDGQLYKETWPEACNAACFDDGLKEGSEDHAPILGLQEDITTENDGCRLGALSEYFDVQQLYNYFAVDAAIANWDGATAFYCGATGSCDSHNFYIYRSLESVYTLIPWDMDQTLVPSTPFDTVPHWLSPGNCSARFPLDLGISGTVAVQPAGCASIFKALAEAPESFSTALDGVLSGPFNVTAIQTAIDGYKALLEPHITASAKDDLDAWTTAVAQLRSDIPALHSKAIALKTV